MIQSLLDRFPDSWDTALPWVIFAYRELPVETLDCSPFELANVWPYCPMSAAVSEVCLAARD